MEVSKDGSSCAPESRSETVSGDPQEPGGHALIQTVVTLTGLPDPLVRQELNQILENSGQNAHSLTLDQLREALAAHLESLQADLMAQGLPVSE